MTDQFSIWLSWCWPAVPMWQVAEDGLWSRCLDKIPALCLLTILSGSLSFHVPDSASQSGSNIACLMWVLVRIQWVKICSLRAEQSRAELPRCRITALSLISLEHRTPKVHRHLCIWQFYGRSGELGVRCQGAEMKSPVFPGVPSLPLTHECLRLFSSIVSLSLPLCCYNARLKGLAQPGRQFSASQEVWIFLWSWGGTQEGLFLCTSPGKKNKYKMLS